MTTKVLGWALTAAMIILVAGLIAILIDPHTFVRSTA